MYEKDKKPEPFNWIGIRSIIYSKEQAVSILRANSYYLFVTGAIGLIIYFLISHDSLKVKIEANFFLLASIAYVLAGVLIRWLYSRGAAVVSLIMSAFYIVTFFIYGADKIWMIFPPLICLLSSYRAMRASFYYHSKSDSITKGY